MESGIRLLVVDDQIIVRMGINNLLRGAEGICMVGEADCGKRAIELARSLRPDVMLLDIKLPDMSGIEVLHRLRSEPVTSQIRVVILTVYDDLEIATEAIRAGAIGYILKDLTPRELLDAIHAAYRGVPLLSDSVARKLVSTLFRTESLPGADREVEEENEAGTWFDLTEREYEIVRLVAKGYSNKSVARELSISLSTVKTHLRHIFKKVGVEDRAQLIIRAIKDGII